MAIFDDNKPEPLRFAFELEPAAEDASFCNGATVTDLLLCLEEELVLADDNGVLEEILGPGLREATVVPRFVDGCFFDEQLVQTYFAP